MSETSGQSESHIDSIVRQEEEALERRSIAERLADGVGIFAGKPSLHCPPSNLLDWMAASEQWQDPYDQTIRPLSVLTTRSDRCCGGSHSRASY